MQTDNSTGNSQVPSGLSNSAAIGIGVGSAVGGMLVVAAMVLLLRFYTRRRRIATEHSIHESGVVTSPISPLSPDDGGLRELVSRQINELDPASLPAELTPALPAELTGESKSPPLNEDDPLPVSQRRGS